MPTRRRRRQRPPGNGKTRHAYLWAYRSGVLDDGPPMGVLDDGPPMGVFDYQTSRASAHARAFLQGWRRGHLMVDDYVGYKALFTEGPTELACLAHIRRKFFDVHAASGSPVAEEALRRIARLYAIGQQGAGLDPRGGWHCASNWRSRRWRNCTPGCWPTSGPQPPAAARRVPRLS